MLSSVCDCASAAEPSAVVPAAVPVAVAPVRCPRPLAEAVCRLSSPHACCSPSGALCPRSPTVLACAQLADTASPRTCKSWGAPAPGKDTVLALLRRSTAGGGQRRRWTRLRRIPGLGSFARRRTAAAQLDSALQACSSISPPALRPVGGSLASRPRPPCGLLNLLVSSCP